MSLTGRAAHCLRLLLRRDQADNELDEEVQSYFDTMTERRIAQGMSREEAQRAVRQDLEHPAQVKEKVRDAWTGMSIEIFIQDIRFGFRVFKKNPGFALAAILSLGLGLGANTAIFTLVDTVMLRTLPVKAPERLFFIDSSGGRSGGNSGPPYPCFELLRDNNHYFSAMAAFSSDRFRVTIDGSAEHISGQYASGSFFELLGVRAALGRLLTPADDSEVGRGGPNGGVTVISYGLWERRFGRSPSVLGKSVQVGTNWVTIVGVTQPGFQGVDTGSPVDFTIPMMLSTNNLTSKRSWWFSVIGRLKDRASPEQARAELDASFQPYMRETGPKGEMQKYFTGIVLVPAAQGLAGLRKKLSKPLLIVMTIVGLVLLIGCANVANLLLARASARRNEIAMRFALGAGRIRILRQLLTEGLLLAGAAALAGFLFAKWGVTFLTTLLAGARGRIVLDPQFDLRIIAFASVVALLTCLLFSIAPAWHSLRADGEKPGEAARTTAGRSQFRTGNALVVVQIMISVVLLCGAALFALSLRNLTTLDAGFHRDGIYTIRVDSIVPRKTPPGVPYKPTEEEIAKDGRMWEDLLEPLQSLPQIKAAAVSTLSPLSGRDRGVGMDIIGESAKNDRGIHINQVSGGYFETLGVALLAGRAFAPTDVGNSLRVVILNESAVRARFPNSNPVGQRVTFPGQYIPGPYQIVGVVRDTRYASLRKPAEPMAYVPVQQAIEPLRGVTVIVRESGDGSGILTAMRRRVNQIIPGGFMSNILTIQQQVDESLIEERLLSILASLFGTLALLLALIGLYGIMSFTVIRRTREIGIRIAVGAPRPTILWLVLRDTLRLVVAGLALGIPVVWLSRKYIESELFGIKGADPVVITATALLLLVVAFGAGCLPAWRASRVDPLLSLRHE